MRPRGGAGISPLACRRGRAYFKVTGALCKQSPRVGDRRQTPHPAPKSGRFGKPKPPGQGGCRRLCSPALGVPRCSAQRGTRGPGRGTGSPAHRLSRTGLGHPPASPGYRWHRSSGRDAPHCGQGKEKHQEGYFVACARGLGKTPTVSHSLVPGGVLASRHRHRCCRPCFHRAMAHPPLQRCLLSEE